MVNSNSLGFHIHICKYINKKILKKIIYITVLSTDSKNIFLFKSKRLLCLVLLAWIVHVLYTTKKSWTVAKYVYTNIICCRLSLNYIRINLYVFYYYNKFIVGMILENTLISLKKNDFNRTNTKLLASSVYLSFPYTWIILSLNLQSFYHDFFKVIIVWKKSLLIYLIFIMWNIIIKKFCISYYIIIHTIFSTFKFNYII